MVRFKAFGRVFTMMTPTEHWREAQDIYTSGCEDNTGLIHFQQETIRELIEKCDSLQAELDRLREIEDCASEFEEDR